MGALSKRDLPGGGQGAVWDAVDTLRADVHLGGRFPWMAQFEILRTGDSSSLMEAPSASLGDKQSLMIKPLDYS